MPDLVAPALSFLGALTGAGAATFGKYFVDRKTRLLDEKLKTAVAFLAAADRVMRVSSSHDRISRRLENMQRREASSDQREKLSKQWDQLNEDSVEAWRDAQRALNAIRLLVPSAVDEAEKYLNLCSEAGYPDDKKGQREASRRTTEDLLRQAVNLK